MNGTHLILLPGMLLDAELFAHQTEHLKDVAEVRVGDITTAASVAGMARAVLDDAPERFALVGLSLGGIVAFEILRRAPERVERLALLDTNARPPTGGQLESWRRFAAMIEEGRFAEVNREYILPSLVHPDRLEDAAITGAIEQMAGRVGPKAFLRQLRAQEGRPDSRERLGEISCPTLVAGGRQDALCSVGMHEEISSGIPGSWLVMIEECGHLSSMERPQAITALLRCWLQNG